MKKSWFAPCAALALILLAPTAKAAIYKYVDSDGNVTFMDKYRPGAVKIADMPDEPPAAPKSRRASKYRSASPTDFPKVDATTQRKRDDIRRDLLQEERNSEAKSLAAARANLTAAGNRPPAEQAKLTENVRLHEKNIEMLDKELARIK